MSACTWASCAMCGRCSDEWERRPDSDAPAACDTCGGTVYQPVSLAGVGLFCSRECADLGAKLHESLMQKRRSA